MSSHEPRTVEAHSEPDPESGAGSAVQRAEYLFSSEEIETVVDAVLVPVGQGGDPDSASRSAADKDRAGDLPNQHGKEKALVLRSAPPAGPRVFTKSGTGILFATHAPVREPERTLVLKHAPASSAALQAGGDSGQTTLIRPLVAPGERKRDDAQPDAPSSSPARTTGSLVPPGRTSSRRGFRALGRKARWSLVLLPLALLAGVGLASRAVEPGQRAAPPRAPGAGHPGAARPDTASQPARPAPLPPATSVPEQRRAADLLIGGELDAAFEAYTALARAHPEQAAYAEAARILGRRRGGENVE